jgi:hypothetical protein
MSTASLEEPVKRSLTVMFVMGVIGMAMLTMLGSFLVGKVGGAERVGTLKADIVAIFGSQMKDPESMEVKVTGSEGDMGLLIEYKPSKRSSRTEGAVRLQMKRIAVFVFGDQYWRKRARFVKVSVVTPKGKRIEERFDPALSSSAPSAK